MAGDTDSAAVVVQVTLAVPAVIGLAGVQVRAGRLMVGGAASAIATIAVVVKIAKSSLVAVMVATAGPGIVGRLAGTIVIVSVCRAAAVQIGPSVINGQGETAGDPQLEVKLTVPAVPNCCSCVVNEVMAGFA